MSDLTILCVSAGREWASPFIETMRDHAEQLGANFLRLRDGEDVHSGGYIESVLDEAVARCETAYVLRLDDDEKISGEMLRWLGQGHYRESEHWAFPRRNLWPDASRYITNPPLWPDLQTRLSVKAKAASRTQIHSGSPFGTGRVAPVAIEHHKFLVRSEEERRALVERYDAIVPGAGAQYAMFSLPERYEKDLKCALI